MKLIATNKNDQNTAAIDPWTAVHTTSGLVAGLLDIPFGRAMTLAIAYEVIEHFAQQKEVGRSFFRVSAPEILPNAIVDVVVFAVGWELGRRWNASGRVKSEE